MGESIPQTKPLTDPRAGSVNLADWLNLSSIVPAVANQFNVLVPTQEMRPFQRRIQDQDVEAGPTVGQFALFQATVPFNEAWKILDVTMEQDDSVPHVLRWRYTPRLGIGGFRMVARKTIAANVATPLYSSFSDEGIATGFAVRGPQKTEFFPNDVITFADTTPAVNANVTWALRIRYELIPLPFAIRQSAEWVGSAF